MENKRQFPRKRIDFKKSIQTLLWVLIPVAILLIMTLIKYNSTMDFMVKVHIVRNYIGIILVTIFLSTILYHGSLLITNNKLARVLLVMLIFTMGLLIYKSCNNRPVRIQEEQLIIKPTPKL